MRQGAQHAKFVCPDTSHWRGAAALCLSCAHASHLQLRVKTVCAYARARLCVCVTPTYESSMFLSKGF